MIHHGDWGAGINPDFRSMKGSPILNKTMGSRDNRTITDGCPTATIVVHLNGNRMGKISFADTLPIEDFPTVDMGNTAIVVDGRKFMGFTGTTSPV